MTRTVPAEPDDYNVLGARRWSVTEPDEIDGIESFTRMFMNVCAIEGHRPRYFTRRCKVCSLPTRTRA